ncbi:carbamoyltransferase HypF [Helicobacter labetoulli]|uniref:carbamoyltransferase HypF n=1 Tax=Helicobacter labetoulli TaxID=2315333 RepID=UPI000EF6BE82|nr:carbamoyltransferase HypF [Helicobacter labetoulli]
MKSAYIPILKQDVKNAYTIELFGVIQGVGFRPFVYRGATSLNLKGYVQNRYNSLFIYLESTQAQSEQFLQEILHNPPPNAVIQGYTISQTPALNSPCSDFKILPSRIDKQDDMLFLPQDLAICQACLNDMRRDSRFKDYAFTTCSYCGARHSIIHALPYDRDNTSMREFKKCKDCEREYHTPTNRRFHAQPISCNQCAIRMRLIIPSLKKSYIFAYPKATSDVLLLAFVAQKIMEGKIIAIKGVGGFNLIASATNIQAIMSLKKRKNRSKKPFAIMFKNLQDIASVAEMNEMEKNALLSPQAPIVLLNKRHKQGNNGILSEQALELIAPQVASIGAILPYNGIMHLLFRFLKTPLIFTSANVSGEPIITRFNELMDKLSGVFDMVLDYDREITHALDDSIVRCMAGEIRPLRLGRGYTPIFLPFKSEEKMCLGLGAQQKSSISLAYKNTLISPYFGDLHSVDSTLRYERELLFFLHLYTTKPKMVVSDLHPQYASSLLAKNLVNNTALLDLSILLQLSHHKAHFYAILAESNALNNDAFGIIWDGTGLGEDGSIWGGEGFWYDCDEMSMSRIFSLKPFALLGGEVSIKEIGRLALGLLWSYGIQTQNLAVEHIRENISLLRNAFESKVFLRTSSMGRLIDCVAYLLGILEAQSYEGQSGALLESYALREKAEVLPYPFSIKEGVIDCKEMIEQILITQDKAKGAKRFLESLAHMALDMSKEALAHRQVLQREKVSVFFSGGVFQNKFLCDRIHALFKKHNIPFYMHKHLPCNDFNISFGQVVFGSMWSENKGEKQ